MDIGIGAIRDRAFAFRESLQRTKLELAPENEWYPYDSLSNFAHLDRLLTDKAASLFDDVRGWTIADIGAADGDVAFFLESLGAGTIDIIDNPPTNWNGLRGAARMRDALASKVTIHTVDLDAQFKLPRETYSLIVFLGILYHLKNPFYILEQLAKASSRLLLSTRITRFANDLTTDLSNIPVAYLVDRFETNNDPTNFWIFSDAGLKRIIDRAGWDIEAYMTVGNTENSNPSTWDGDERAFCLLRSRFGVPAAP
jgi:tRNA (mo5U34)-methyltransferase